MSEMIRFFCVTVLGLVIDIAIAIALAEWVGVPLWFAATCGFIVAACTNYVIHQLWSFQSGPRTLSTNRAAKYLAVAALTLGVRVAIVAQLEAILGVSYALIILLVGACGSFLVNFGLSKFCVFSAPSNHSGAPR